MLLALDFYIFNGLKSLFRNGMPKSLKWAYWLATLLPLIWMMIALPLQQYLADYRWLSNFFIGIFFTLLITKGVYGSIMLIEDVYRIFRYSGENLMTLADKQREPFAWESRRRFVAQLGIAFASLPFFSFLYGVTRGKYAFTVHKVRIDFPDLPEAFDGLRIVQISDVHAGSFDSVSAVQRGTELVQAQNPDIILFTGDLVNNRAEEIEPYIHLFEKLNAPMGKFSVLGNHDYAHYVPWKSEAAEAANMQRLFKNHAAMGFKLLNNESLLLEKNGQNIRLAGVENWGKGRFPKEGDLDKTFAGTAADEFRILMSHDPSHWTHKILGFDKQIHLTLSGHTHGMQMGVEIPGIKWSPSSWIYPQWAGLYNQDKKYLYVNRGFGFLGFPGRVGILPEITVLELKRGLQKNVG
jgi:predicted MPP superfamily phosphohydrolase